MSDQRAQQSGTGTRAIVPAARVDDLVITETGDELVVYDKERHHIHHLNHTSAVVWRLCDGRRSIDDVANDGSIELGAAIDEEVVRAALTYLADAGLLSGEMSGGTSPQRGSRRALVRRAAIKGAIVAPLVMSMTAPTAAMASSCPSPYVQNGGCTADVDGCMCTNGKDGNGEEQIGVCTPWWPGSTRYNCM